jgi:hypothetical protein
MPKPVDITELAKRLHRCIAEYNDTHDDRMPVTSAMSRILEHDPSYVPHRPRRANRLRKKLAGNVGLQTIARIAEHVGVSVGYLIGEAEALSTFDRQKLNAIGRFLVDRFPAPDSGRWSGATNIRLSASCDREIDQD